VDFLGAVGQNEVVKDLASLSLVGGERGSSTVTMSISFLCSSRTGNEGVQGVSSEEGKVTLFP